MFFQREHDAFLKTEKIDVFVTAFLGLKAVYHALAPGLSLASGLSPVWLSETRNAPCSAGKRILLPVWTQVVSKNMFLDISQLLLCLLLAMKNSSYLSQSIGNNSIIVSV